MSGERGAFTDVFVERPVLAAVLSLVALLLGVLAFERLAVRETPELQPPTVTVTTAWPGADPAIVESDVTEILERQVNGIEGVRTLTSTSREQVSQITVEFELERNLEEAANDVRARVGRARKDLPPDVEEPVVEKADADAQPVLFLRLAADDRDLLELTDIADTLVRERLQTVPGVSNVEIYGEQKYAMRIELDPGALAARHVAVADVQAALGAGNVDAPAGRVEGATTDLTVRVDGGARTPEAFADLVVAVRDGAVIRLGDLGHVRLGAENERTAAHSDGVPSITVAVLPQAQANIIDISDEVQRRLPDVRAALPAGVSIDVNYDRTNAVRSSIREVEETLVIAFVLVVLVIFAFLRDWRSTLVPAVAIPVSIVGTFLFLWLAGFSINVFTLFGLVLAIGLVVDDAIVVLENVYRRIELGEAPRVAAILGTRQIVFAILATTLSLVMVFLPVIFTGGTTGRLFLEFGSTVAVAVALSGAVALTLTPMLSSQILREKSGEGWLKRVTEPLFDGLNRAFAASLGLIVRFPLLAVGMVLVATGVGALGFWQLPREFFPLEDRNVFFVRTLAPEGTGYPWMNARMTELEPELMQAVPERVAMLTRVASGTGGSAAAANTGMYVFPLVPKEERDRTQQEIVGAVARQLADVTAFVAIPIQPPTVGRGFQPPVQVVLLHPDFEALAGALPGFVAEMRKIGGLSAVNEDLKLNRPEISVAIDRDKAAKAGIAPNTIARTLQVLTGNLELSQFKRGARSYAVLVGLEPEARANPDDLLRVEVRAADGTMVPIGNFVRFTEQSAASSRYHYNRTPSATVSANLDGITLGEALDRIQAMSATQLAPGFRIAFAGESREYQDANQALGLVFALAIALVYLTLAAQFDSFVDPVGILVSVPLALSGAFAGLWIMGMTLSFFAQVGLILLIGLVTKNGILIVEYARQLAEEQPLTRWEAATEAAKIRFRPVVMTSVATIVGALPIALGFSSSSRAPLGVAVVAGMTVATALTLYVTPVFYAALASGVDRLRGQSRRPSALPVTAVVALLAVGIGYAPAARAADALTLGEAFAMAEADNYDLRRARTSVEAADASADQTRAGLFPAVAASGTITWGQTSQSAALGTSGPIGSAQVKATLPLLNAAGWTALRASELRFDAAAAGLEADREAVLALVGFRYVDLARGEQAVLEAAALHARSRRLLALAEDRVAVGAAAPIEATRARLVERQDEQREIAAGTSRDAARLRLRELLGLPLAGDLGVQFGAPLAEPPTGEGSRPDLAEAEANAAAAAADRRAALAEAVPYVDAFGTAGALTAPGIDVAPTAAVGLEATVPLFTGTGRLAEARRLAATAEGASLLAEQVSRAAAVEVEVADLAVRDAGFGLAVARDARALAEQELALAEDRFSSGASSNVEVVDAQARLAAAVGADIDALAAYNLAILDAWRARGRLGELATGEVGETGRAR